MRTLRSHLGFIIVSNLVLWINCVFAQPDFVPYPDNPILTYGNQGSWDAGVVYLPNVIYKDGLFYMFYTGSEDLSSVPISIGYATSEDGYTWTKYSGNPVFEADGTGFDAHAVAKPTILLEDSLWVMYYNGHPAPRPGPGPYIGRATATDAAGPWERLEDPVLTHGNPGEWDYYLTSPGRVIATDSGYVMYYNGGGNFMASETFMTGMAFSPDGIVWTKYDDPTTTDSLFATSDPVLRVGAPGSYDGGTAAFCDVLRTDSTWEMFYTGSPGVFSGPARICYATSSDGIHWVKDPGNPLLEPTQSWESVMTTPNAIIVNDTTYFLYYVGRTTPFDGQIGLATAPIHPVNVESQPISTIPTLYRLYDNYPNPFNPTTKISWQSPVSSRQTLIIYDVLGNEIATLVDEEKSAGKYEIEFNSHSGLPGIKELTSGVYFYQLRAGEFIQTKKMILLR